MWNWLRKLFKPDDVLQMHAERLQILHKHNLECETWWEPVRVGSGAVQRQQPKEA